MREARKEYKIWEELENGRHGGISLRRILEKYVEDNRRNVPTEEIWH
jgi:hypothetical protein